MLLHKSNKTATGFKKNRVPNTIYPAVTLSIITTVLNMFYKKFILWKQGIH